MTKTMSVIKFFKIANKDHRLVYPLIGESEEPIKMTLPFVKKALWYFTAPAQISHVLNSTNYIRDPRAIVALRDLQEGGLDVPHDFLAEDAEALKKMFSPEREKAILNAMTKAIQKSIDKWTGLAGTQQTVNLEYEATSLFVQIYLDGFLSGIDISDVGETAKFINTSFNSFFFLNYTFQSLANIPGPLTERYRIYRKLKKQAAGIGFEYLEKSMQQQSTDFNVVRYLADYFKYPTDMNQWDINMKRHLAGRSFATMVSSTHNNAGSMMHTLAALSTHPEIRKKIAEEVKNVVGNRTPNYDDLDKLIYTRSVFLESTRLYPPVLNHFRIALHDETFSGMEIKKGDVVIIPAFVCQRFSKYWQNPEGFEPERFMQPLTTEQKELFLTFSYGPQGCIARRFATLEATLILAMLSQQSFELNLVFGSTMDFDPNLLFFSGRINPDVLMQVVNKRS